MPSSPDVASRWKFMSWITRSMPPRATRSSPSRGVAAHSTRRALERQQDIERRAHGVVVVDDQYRPSLHAASCAAPRDSQTVRVAIAGDTIDARRAGRSAAARLTLQSTTTPASR